MATITTTAFEIRSLSLEVVESDVDITNNKRKYRWKLYGSGSGKTWYMAGNFYASVGGIQVYSSSSRIQLGNGTVIAEGEIWLDHNSDGSKYVDMYCHAAIYTTAVNKSANGGFNATSIPRQANVLSANNFSSDQNPYFTFTNPANFKIDAYLEFGEISIKRSEIPNTGNYTFMLTKDEKNLLFSKCPNSNFLNVKYVLVTKINNIDTWWSWIDRTMTVVNSNPEYTAVDLFYKDTNIDVVNITNNNQNIVRNISNLEITFGSAIAKNYSTISKYEIIFNGITIIQSVGTFNLGKVNAANDVILYVKAIDSRGNYSIIQKTVKILDWVNPSAIISANRVNNFENIVKLKIDSSISNVDSKNEITSIVYRCKKVNDSKYLDDINIINNTIIDVDVDNRFAWNFQVVISDKFGNTTYNFIIAKGIPIMFFDTDKLSVSINGFAKNENSFDVEIINGKKIIDLMYPIGSIYMNYSNNSNPSIFFDGTWVALTDRFLIGAGSTYSNNSIGGTSTVTLTTAQMPSHNHGVTYGGVRKHTLVDTGINDTTFGWHATDGVGGWKASPGDYNLVSNGGNGYHENMPPYRAVYMWYRSA